MDIFDSMRLGLDAKDRELAALKILLASANLQVKHLEAMLSGKPLTGKAIP